MRSVRDPAPQPEPCIFSAISYGQPPEVAYLCIEMARLPPKPLDWGDDEAATRVQRDAASLSLVAHQGPLDGHVFGTDGDAITIGRGSSCAVHLALSDISRRHAVIRYRAGRYWVEDLQTLNGTRVNQQLIDGPTSLHHGDRIHVGAQEFEVRLDAVPHRQVVYDGPNSEAMSISPSGRVNVGAAPPPAKWPIGPFGFAIVAVLAVSTGVLLAFAITREGRHSQQARNQSTVPAAPSPPGAPNPSAPLPALVKAHIELDGAVELAAPEAGIVQWTATRGTPVRAGDDVVRFRRSLAAKQAELDRINEKLEDDDSNPGLIRRAHALANELDNTPLAGSIKSSFDGVVLETPATKSRLQPGVGEVRVARSVRLVLDAGSVVGNGSGCRVAFLGQRLAAEGRRVVGGDAATIELTRFPAELTLDDVGRVRADCN